MAADAKEHGYKVISSVGGQKIPPVDHYIAGYQAGQAGRSGIQTLNGDFKDFTDQTKCKELVYEIGQGSKVVFQVPPMVWVRLSAAQQKGLQGIGLM